MAGDADPDDLFFFPFTKAEMEAVKPVLRAFEEAFGFDSEGNTVEQLIDTRFAGVAEGIARDAAGVASSEIERAALLRVAEALATALEVGSYVEVAFG